jgi:hypothetical protein
VSEPVSKLGLTDIQKLLIGICALSAALLLVSGNEHSRDFFALMRFVIFCGGALASCHFHRSGNVTLALIFGATALLFNPFAPIRLQRSTWQGIDLATAILFVVGGYLVWRKR